METLLLIGKKGGWVKEGKNWKDEKKVKTTSATWQTNGGVENHKTHRNCSEGGSDKRGRAEFSSDPFLLEKVKGVKEGVGAKKKKSDKE